MVLLELCLPFIWFLAAPAVAPISVNLTLNGVNETTFAGMKAILEQAIADANNIPLSSVSAEFVGMAATVSTRSSDDRAVINVIITPTDTDEETEALENMVNNTESFLSEINADLASHNVDVLSMSEVERIPGLWFDYILYWYF